MVLTVVGVRSPPSQACPATERGPVPVEEGGRPLHLHLVKGICGYDLGKASQLEGVVGDPSDFGDPSQAAWGLSVLQR